MTPSWRARRGIVRRSSNTRADLRLAGAPAASSPRADGGAALVGNRPVPLSELCGPYEVVRK
jgi:hypothetical protein